MAISRRYYRDRHSITGPPVSSFRSTPYALPSKARSNQVNAAGMTGTDVMQRKAYPRRRRSIPGLNSQARSRVVVRARVEVCDR